MEAFAQSREDLFSDKLGSRLFADKRFKVIRELDNGGTSKVFLVQDNLLDKLVVFKEIDQKLLEKKETRSVGIKEALIGRHLSHKNIIKIFDIRHDEDREYLVMEYLQGSSLKNILSRQRLNYDKSILILKPLVDALDYMHSQGLVHSDVKPSNIILTADEQVKLIDLANCRQDSLNDDAKIKVDNNLFFGYSIDYSSPQVVEDRPATVSDDVYSLACIVYELLTEKLPSSSESEEYYYRTLEKPSSINYLQWIVLQRAMSSEQTKRFSSIQKFYLLFTLAKDWFRYAMTLILALLVVFIVVTTSFEGIQKYNKYKSSYDQIAEFNLAVESIKQADPKEQLEMFDNLRQFPDVLSNSAKTSLYSSIVPPRVARIEAQINPFITLETLHGFQLEVEQLKSFYPHSADLNNIDKVLAEERDALLNSFTSRLIDITENGAYDRESGQEINIIAQRIEFDDYSYRTLLKHEYVEDYQASRDLAISEHDWKSTLRHHNFAVAVNLPEFHELWDKKTYPQAYYAKEIGSYLASEDDGERGFPELAVTHFLEPDFTNFKEELESAKNIKDFDDVSIKLFSLRDQYQIPENYTHFEQALNTLTNKLQDKISYHSEKNHRKTTAAYMELLKKIESKQAEKGSVE